MVWIMCNQALGRMKLTNFVQIILHIASSMSQCGMVIYVSNTIPTRFHEIELNIQLYRNDSNTLRAQIFQLITKNICVAIPLKA